VAFFSNPCTQLSRHLLHITTMQRQLVGNLLVGYIQSHEVETQYPDFQRLMMARKDGVRQIIKAVVTVSTFIGISIGLCVFK
jgi:hypothetical protein